MYCFFKPETLLWKKYFLTFATLLFGIFPFVFSYIQKTKIFSKITNTLSLSNDKKSFWLFLSSCISLWFLSGLLLPSSVISSSPIEFSFLGSTDSPIQYILSSFSFFFGFFVFWPIMLYKLFGNKAKKVLPFLFFILVIISFSNVYIFKSDYGTINNAFILDNATILSHISIKMHIIIIIFFIFIISLTYLIFKINKIQYATLFTISILIAQTSFSIYKISFINKTFNTYSLSKENQIENISAPIKPVYHLSKTNKNVIILFLDRAIGAFSEHIFNQFPELKKDFSGFIYYPNTLSSGGNTINGFPPITGGYEYSSEEIYKRKDELLVKKHNEALRIMPELFYNAGFDVTYTDPSMANYSWAGDLTIFDKYPNMKVSSQFGKYTQRYANEKDIIISTTSSDIITKSQIKNFSILQILFPFFRTVFYNTAFHHKDDIEPFVSHIANLYYLPNLTDFNSNNNTLTIIENEVTHHPVFLQSPEYEKPIESKTEIILNNDYKNFNDIDLMDYNVNIAAYKQISKYIKYLKENNIYDNSRIIIVSDHGFHHHYTTFNNFSDPIQPSSFNCLLMVKDFYAEGEAKSDMTFMTNADTLFFAKKDLPISDINPFTEKKLEQKKDYIICCPTPNNQWNITYMINKNNLDYSKAQCWKVHDNIFNPDNWEPYTFQKGDKN
jgi:hypothetical protein